MQNNFDIIRIVVFTQINPVWKKDYLLSNKNTFMGINSFH
jgi:hypothetical protein